MKWGLDGTTPALVCCASALAPCAAVSIVLASAAHAQTSCNASNQFSFSFANQAGATLSYASTYNYNASNGLGQTQQFAVSFGSYNLSSSQAGGQQMPRIGNLVNGGGTSNALVIGGTFTGRTTDISANSRVIVTRFTFTAPVREISMTVHDIDYTLDQFRDWLAVIGRNGASSYVPVLTTPFGQTSGAGNTHSSGSSSVRLGPETTPLAIAASDAVGVGSSDNNATTGNVTLRFAQPVTEVELRYGNYPYQGGSDNSTGQQAYGISTMSFCPMPAIAAVKTSVPEATTGDTRFAIPGSRIIYTITVTNSGGSTVDANGTTIVDLLPAQMAFVNGSYGGAGMPVQFVAGGSGLSLGAANISYSNNGGSTFAYTPSAGVDANVSAIRISPQGTMAANSSFSVAFLADVK